MTVRIDLLQKLLDLCENVILPKHSDQFDMSTWGEEMNRSHRPKCGTAACLGGWAYSIPEFREAGLVHVNGQIFFGEEYGGEAMGELLGLSVEDSTSLFYDCDEEAGAEGGEAVKVSIRKLKAIIAREKTKEVP